MKGDMDDLPLILVVDDEADFREILSVKLASVGFHVETAENGQEGIEKAKRLKPKLVLMDVKMPVMDGAMAALVLREDPETRAIKVVFLTSLGDPRLDMEDIDRKFSAMAGAVQYIKKTDNLENIAEQVKQFAA